MPRVRKQTARFDPSPEAVASWNDTSGALREHVNLLARVRHGLTPADAELLAKANAAKAALKEQIIKPKPKQAGARGAGKKRPRTSAAGGEAAASGEGVGSAEGESEAPYVGGWPRLAEPRETGGGRDGGSQVDGNNHSASSDVTREASTYSSSFSPSTSGSGSGSDSDSDCSYASVMSHKNLPWRRPGAPAVNRETADQRTAGALRAVAGGGAADTPSSAGPPSATASDTDSEYASTGGGDIISPLSDASGGSASGSSRGTLGGVGDGPVQADGVDREREEPHRVKRTRNVVTVRLARSEMPARFAVAQPLFATCLNSVLPEDRVGTGVRNALAVGGRAGASEGGGAAASSSAAAAEDAFARASAVMMALDPGDGANSNAWLSSAFIDVVLAKFARTYPGVHFMPCEFAKLDLKSSVGTGKRSASPPVSGRSSPPTIASTTALAMAGPAPPDGAADDVSTGEVASDDGTSELVSQARAAFARPDRQYCDILRRPIVYSERRPVIFLTHVNNVHWNLLRVEHTPVPELQLFEPLGKPPPRRGHQTAGGHHGDGTTRARGTGFRCIPKAVYEWLDEVWPLNEYSVRDGDKNCCANPDSNHVSASSSTSGGGGGGTHKRARSNVADGARGRGCGSKRSTSSAVSTGNDGGWFGRAYSAITRQQQTTGFDCGVATLLYAEKCGQGQMRQDVNAWTDQADMTAYRVSLQKYVHEALGKSEPHGTTGTPGPSAPAMAALSSPPPASPAPPSSESIPVATEPHAVKPLKTSSTEPSAPRVSDPASRLLADTANGEELTGRRGAN